LTHFKFTLTEAIALFAFMLAFSYYLSFNFLLLEILGEKTFIFAKNVDVLLPKVGTLGVNDSFLWTFI